MIGQEIVSQKPLIGISANLLTMEGGSFAGQERAYINYDYVNAVIKAQGAPVLLPVIPNQDAIVQQVSLLDGVLLSGGSDIQPLLYGKEPLIHLDFIYPERDIYEMEVIKIAYQMKKPIFGICRGLQLINVVFGGTLYQDISHYSPFTTIQHMQKAKMYVASHTVDLVPNTRLQQIFNQDLIFTNSYHHQAVEQLAPGFIVNAKAKDGIIEGIEKEDHPFFIAVQWHPEFMVEKHEGMLSLFKAFIKAAYHHKSRCRSNE